MTIPTIFSMVAILIFNWSMAWRYLPTTRHTSTGCRGLSFDFALRHQHHHGHRWLFPHGLGEKHWDKAALVAASLPWIVLAVHAACWVCINIRGGMTRNRCLLLGPEWPGYLYWYLNTWQFGTYALYLHPSGRQRAIRTWWRYQNLPRSWCCSEDWLTTSPRPLLMIFSYGAFLNSSLKAQPSGTVSLNCIT